MDQSDLAAILEKHQRWQAGQPGGERASFAGASLDHLSLGKADLRKADFSSANLRGVNFGDSDLRQASFDDATMALVNFGSANLASASFRRARLHNINFGNADLTGADFRGCKSNSVNCLGAKTTGVRGLWGTRLSYLPFQHPGILVAIFLAFMLAVAGTAIVPSTARLAAPILCANRSATVKTTTSSPMPGTTRVSWSLLCTDAAGRREVINPFAVMALLFVFYLGPSGLAVWVYLRRRRTA